MVSLELSTPGGGRLAQYLRKALRRTGLPTWPAHNKNAGTVDEILPFG
jgi:hypothetical protein